MNDNSKCIDEFRFPELPIQIQLKRFTSSIQTYAFSGKIISDDDLYVVINSNLDGQLEIYRVKCENSSEFCNSLTGTISCAPFDAEIFLSTPTTRFRNCSLCGEKLEDEALLVVGKNEL